MISKESGFTLIELLVVIAIIGILASIILASLGATRVRARDTQRVAALQQMRNALELYYSDHGHYPVTSVPCGGVWTSFDSPSYSGVLLCDDGSGQKTLTAIMAPYIGKLSDPASLGADSGYLYRSDGTNYCFMIFRTPENLTSYTANEVDPARCGSSNTTAQCSVNGTAGGATNAVFIGQGTFATAGC